MRVMSAPGQTLFHVLVLIVVAVSHVDSNGGLEAKASGELRLPVTRKMQSDFFLFPPTYAPTPASPVDSGRSSGGDENKASESPVEGDKTGAAQTGDASTTTPAETNQVGAATTTSPTSRPTSMPTIKETEAPHGPVVEEGAIPTSRPTSMPTIKETEAPHGPVAEDTPAPTMAVTSATTAATSRPTSMPTIKETEAPHGPVEEAVPTPAPTLGTLPSSQPTSVPTIKETEAPHGPVAEDTPAPTMAVTSATTAATSRPTSMPTIKETEAPHGPAAEDTPAPTVAETSVTTAAPSNGAAEIPVVPMPALVDSPAPSLATGGGYPSTGKRPGGRPGGGGGRGKKSRPPTMRGSRKPSPPTADSGETSGGGSSNGGSDSGTPPPNPTLAPTHSSETGTGHNSGDTDGGPYNRYGKDDDNWTDNILGPDYSSNFVMIISGILLVAVIACFVWVYNQVKQMCSACFGEDPGAAPSDESYTPVNTTDFDRIGVDRNEEEEVWDSWDDDNDIEMTMPKQSVGMRSYSGDSHDREYKSSSSMSSSSSRSVTKDSPSRVKKIESNSGWDLDDDLDLDLSLDHVDKDTSYDSLPVVSPPSSNPPRSAGKSDRGGYSREGLSESTLATNPKAAVKVVKGMSLPGAPARKK